MVTKQGFASYEQSAVRRRRAGLEGWPDLHRLRAGLASPSTDLKVGWTCIAFVPDLKVGLPIWMAGSSPTSNLPLSHIVCEMKVNRLWFSFDGFQ
ncbi:hypothetical protein Hanom_Chr17g01558061 [Helianthus anomalus]